MASLFFSKNTPGEKLLKTRKNYKGYNETKF